MGWFATKQEKLDAALLDACYEPHDRNLDKIKGLLAQGANIKARNGYGTPLQKSVDMGSLETVKLLIANKANIQERDYGGRTLLMTAYGTAMIDYLLQQGQDINAKDNSGVTVLHYAAGRGNFAAVKLLLEKGADAGAMDNQGDKPADHAKRSNHHGIADFLQEQMKSSAQPVVPVTTGWTLTAPDEVVFSDEKAGTGYRLTSIFNFNARIYTQIATNMNTRVESQSIRFFDEFTDKTLLQSAFRQMKQLGGQAQETSIYKTVLDKPGAR